MKKDNCDTVENLPVGKLLKLRLNLRLNVRSVTRSWNLIWALIFNYKSEFQLNEKFSLGEA